MFKRNSVVSKVNIGWCRITHHQHIAFQPAYQCSHLGMPAEATVSKDEVVQQGLDSRVGSVWFLVHKLDLDFSQPGIVGSQPDLRILWLGSFPE